MKKFLSNLLSKVSRVNIMYVVTILAIIVAVVVLTKTCNEKKKATDVRTVIQFRDKQLDSSIVKYWKDKYNNEHAIANALTVSSVVKSDYTDSIASLLKIKTKQLQQIAIERTQTNINGGLGVDTVEYGIADTNIAKITSVSFSYKDPWNKVNGTINRDHSKDSIHIHSIDTITSVSYWKRKKFLGIGLGKEQGYVDISNSNPYVEITGDKQLNIKAPVRQYNVSLSIGAGYNPFLPDFNIRRPVFTIGISVGKTLIRF